MPQARSKVNIGLGNSLMKDRFGKGKGADRRKTSSVARINHATGEQYLVNDKQEASWVKMRSVTEQGALDEFLATAELAGTDFTAEKMTSVKIIHTDHKNPYLLSATEERDVLGKHKTFQASLTVPRRPKWDKNTTAEELDRLEKAAFLDWRRGLAEVQENNDLLLTPFERNLEVWRQLWRVIERSDIIVQIVDARNPLLFRSSDLDVYVKDIDPKKENLLLINKADMMTDAQRRAWATYLKEAGIAYRFFSAQLAKEQLEADAEANEEISTDSDKEEEEEEEEEDSEDNTEDKPQEEATQEGESSNEATTENPAETPAEAPVEDNEPVPDEEDIRILTVHELEDILLSYSPENLDRKLQVGLVGYPNVGKSSTINALIGSKKVSVSSTPGKTKHFQTIHLSERVILCDCPGLVFPNFAFTKGDLVCNGVLPIDQLREYTGPVSLVAKRIPQAFLEAVYGIQINTRPVEEGGTGIPTASELLIAYAKARGFQTQGLGQPDESRASRYILKDYVNGKLLFCQPPPGPIDPQEFNRELYDDLHLPERRRAALSQQLDALSIADTDAVSLAYAGSLPVSSKAHKLDKGFFDNKRNASHISRPFNYQYSQQAKETGASKQLTGRKARQMAVLEGTVDAKSSKKHFKGNPRGGKGKNRQNYNDD
ncbi:Large subunit GTPase 1 [Ceratocystis lukuohia]|uniref:Large subunit GTPase 1 n=1 Tax=Ceratocystis lukuohia TaxID=2019550 RepID=A0ABR4MHT8_9PEZI